MGSLSPWHWLIIAVVLIVLFGSKKLPDAARSLGTSLRIFKSEVRELHSEGKSQPAPPPATPVQSERVEHAAPESGPDVAPGPQPADQTHTDARPA